MRKGTAIAVTILLLTCGPPARGPRGPEDQVSATAAFGKAAEAYMRGYLDARPTRAVRLGHHEYDGRLPDVSGPALEAERVRLGKALEDFQDMDEAGLDAVARVEHAVILGSIRNEIFRLEVLRSPWRNPMYYTGLLDLVPYMDRDYRPAEERTRAVIAIASAAPDMLEQADRNLERAIPRTWLETALKQVEGTVPFVRQDVPAALGEPSDPDLAAELREGLGTLATALEGFRDALESRREHATDDYALGQADFLRMLSETQGVDMDLEALRVMAEDDLARNLTAIEEVAGEIDPARSVEEVVRTVVDDKPEDVLGEAASQSVSLRAFLLENDLVTIPSDHVAEVRVSPPFKRWNAASLDSPGPFEEKELPSYYYISPPDPEWPEEVRNAYLPGRWDLYFITIHELWPGHFLHSLHARSNPSPILKSFWTYTTGEGWAHYAEQMMLESGAGGGDPRARIGQLLNALLRNARFVSAIGMHAGSMSVDESAAIFREKAFCDEGNARQQAVRGTFDPMYLSYTLGKLMILELREDWMAARGEGHGLREFHDEFLSYGAAPIPAIREAMLPGGG